MVKIWGKSETVTSGSGWLCLEWPVPNDAGTGLRTFWCRYWITYIMMQVLDYVPYDAGTGLRTLWCRYWITYHAGTGLRTLWCRYWITYLMMQVLDYVTYDAGTGLRTLCCRYWIAEAIWKKWSLASASLNLVFSMILSKSSPPSASSRTRRKMVEISTILLR